MKLAKSDIAQFLEDRGSDSYRKLCRYLLQPFHEWLGNRDLIEGEVKRYAKERYANPKTHNLFLAVMKSFAKWKRNKIPPIGEEHLMQRFELEQIEGVRRERVVRRIEEKGLTLEGLRRALEKCRSDLSFAIVWLLHWTGCRPIELLSFTPKMVDFRDRSVKFTGAKTKVEREVFFDDFTARQIRTFLDAKPTYKVIYHTCKGLGIIPKSGRQTVRSLLPERIEWTPPVRVHELVDLWCGHTVTGMDVVYSEVRPHLKRISDIHYMKPLEEEFR